jgi:hypothetical protein
MLDPIGFTVADDPRSRAGCRRASVHVTST